MYNQANFETETAMTLSMSGGLSKPKWRFAVPEYTTKACSTCHITYPATSKYFHKHSKLKGGLNTICRECANKKTRDWRKNNRERGLQAGKTWRENNLEHARAYMVAYLKAHPLQRKARAKVQNEVDSGRLPSIKTINCVKCGNQAHHYHHWSYEPEHWLDVIPVCRKCHRKIQ